MHDDYFKVYEEMAKKVAAKVIDNMIATMKTGQSPDLYWKLENAVLQALKYADARGAERAKDEYLQLLMKFDSEDGSSQN